MTWFNTASGAHGMIMCPNSGILYGVLFLWKPVASTLVFYMLSWSLSGVLQWELYWCLLLHCTGNQQRGHCTHLWIAMGHALFPQQNQWNLAGLGVITWVLCLESCSPWPKAEINHVIFWVQFSSGRFSNFLELESWPPLMGHTLFLIPNIFQWKHWNLHQNIQTAILKCHLLLSYTWCEVTFVYSAMPVYKWNAAHRYLCAGKKQRTSQIIFITA